MRCDVGIAFGTLDIGNKAEMKNWKTKWQKTETKLKVRKTSKSWSSFESWRSIRAKTVGVEAKG